MSAGPKPLAETAVGRAIVDKVSPEFLKGTPSRQELYDSVAALVEEIRTLKTRMAALEGKGLEFCGTHQRGHEYRRGHVVVAGGSLWIATMPTTDLPGRTAAWALAAKAGRDGKDANYASERQH